MKIAQFRQFVTKAEGMGLEPTTGFTAPHFQSVASFTRQGDSSQGDARVTDDPELIRVNEAWSKLPPDLKHSVLTIVNLAD